MNIVYLTYNGLLEPLGQHQVWAYLAELSRSHGHRFHIISYEKPADWRNPALRRRQELACAALGCTWHPLPYHQRPTVPATLYDVGRGWLRALRIARRFSCELVHIRSYVPMVIGLGLQRRLRLPVLFDMRGLWADERADIGQCSRESRQYRAIKALERRSLERANGIVMLTQRSANQLRAEPPLRERAVPIAVIPCCADLSRFQRDPAARQRIRQALGWDRQRVLVYSGSLGGFYLDAALAELFATWYSHDSRYRLLVLTRADAAPLQTALAGLDMPAEAVHYEAVAPQAMPQWLSAADGALSLIMSSYSKIASSPTKLAEYLGCGLPVISNRGIGDLDTLLSEQIGVLLEGLDASAYARAEEQFQALMQDSNTPQRCRALAEAELALPVAGKRYAAIYAQCAAREVR